MLFNYSCLPFLPTPLPHPSQTHSPPLLPPSPLFLSSHIEFSINPHVAGPLLHQGPSKVCPLITFNDQGSLDHCQCTIGSARAFQRSDHHFLFQVAAPTHTTAYLHPSEIGRGPTMPTHHQVSGTHSPHHPPSSPHRPPGVLSQADNTGLTGFLYLC